jgi:hypothetical protein
MDDKAAERARIIESVLDAPLLDAALAAILYNRRICGSLPCADPIERYLLAERFSQEEIDHAVDRSIELLRATFRMQGDLYLTQTAYEQRVTNLRTEHPGFAEETYEQAVILSAL